MYDDYTDKYDSLRNGKNVLFLDLNEWESSALECTVGRIVGLFFEDIKEIRTIINPLLNDAVSWFQERHVDYVHLSLSGASQSLVNEVPEEG